MPVAAERETLTWDDFGGATRDLARSIIADGFAPDIVVAIARGGLLPAGAIAYGLGVKSCGALNVEFYTGIGTVLDAPALLPPDLDLCFDARFLPNPYFVDELRPKTGLDAAVADYVMRQPDAAPFLEKICDLVAFLIPRFAAEGKSYATVAIGCTGGKHRSVTLAEAAVRRLREQGFDVKVRHRDVEK